MRSGLLGQLYDYRLLLGRRDIVRMALDDDERDQLANLELRFLSISLRRRHLRQPLEMPAAIKVGPEFKPTTVIDVGGGGMRAEPAPELRVGDVTVVKIADIVVGREYHLPVQVAWVAGKRMGLAFFGIPIALRYGGGRAGLADDAAA